MGITAKELAKLTNLSAAAVSMALRNKPGVSEETRKMVHDVAVQHGYDFSRVLKSQLQQPYRNITFVLYKRQGAVVGDTPFFSALTDGIESACAESDFRLHILSVHRDDDVQKKVAELNYSDCVGVVLLGTEMQPEDFRPFSNLSIPMVLLDVYFDSVEYDCILINNSQGAVLATNHLISRTKKQLGYLRSSYHIENFDERADGFYKAVRKHGMSVSKSIVHRLTPSIEGAYADMTELLKRGEELAACYFADNDLIAIGAMKAFQNKGIRIPDDISIVGFDDLPMAAYLEPSLTTIHVPKKYIGEMAVKRLIELMNHTNRTPVKIEVSTNLVKRRSVYKPTDQA